MVDERVLTTVLHVEGGGEVLDYAYIAPGESPIEWGAKQSLTFRTEYRREPWTEEELRRGDLESRIAMLRQEFPSGDYPAPMHPADEPCTECEAIRFLESKVST